MNTTISTRFPMTENKPAPVCELLQNKGVIPAYVLRHSATLRHAADIVERCLPSTLRGHFQIANYRENTLILHADSATWATKLRYSTQDLSSNLAKHQYFRHIQRVRVKVCPHYERNTRTSRRSIMSEYAASALEDLAEVVTNPQLASSLRRLARHGNKRKKGNQPTKDAGHFRL